VYDSLRINFCRRSHTNGMANHPIFDGLKDFDSGLLAEEFRILQVRWPWKVDALVGFIKDGHANGNRTGDSATADLIHADDVSRTRGPEFAL
jgi:hypothetical protein